MEDFIKTFKLSQLYKILGKDVKDEIEIASKSNNLQFLNSIYEIVTREQKLENSLMNNFFKSQENFITEFVNQIEDVRRKFVLGPQKLKVKRAEKKESKKADKILEKLNN